MTLKLEISYNHTLGNFEAKLENGAGFTFERSDVSGKLENNLNLYRRAVIALLDGGELPHSTKRDAREEAIRLSAGRHVQVVGKKKLTKLNLDDLDIDF